MMKESDRNTYPHGFNTDAKLGSREWPNFTTLTDLGYKLGISPLHLYKGYPYIDRNGRHYACVQADGLET